MNYLSFAFLLFFSFPAFSGHSFDRYITEIQILEDVVRLKVGTTYGTCGTKDGWWGWSTSHERHKDWLSLALVAYAQNKKITVHDQQSSCAGFPIAIQLEALYLKSDS